MDLWNERYGQCLTFGDGIGVNVLLSKHFKQHGAFLSVCRHKHILLHGPCTALLGDACLKRHDSCDGSCNFHSRYLNCDLDGVVEFCSLVRGCLRNGNSCHGSPADAVRRL